MAASPGVPTSSPESPFVTSSGTPTVAHPQMEVCRICAKEGSNFVGIFSESGKSRDLPSKVKEHLPVLVSIAIFSLLQRRPVCFCLNQKSVSDFIFRSLNKTSYQRLCAANASRIWIRFELSFANALMEIKN